MKYCLATASIVVIMLTAASGWSQTYYETGSGYSGYVPGSPARNYFAGSYLQRLKTGHVGFHATNGCDGKPVCSLHDYSKSMMPCGCDGPPLIPSILGKIDSAIGGMFSRVKPRCGCGSCDVKSVSSCGCEKPRSSCGHEKVTATCGCEKSRPARSRGGCGRCGPGLLHEFGERVKACFRCGNAACGCDKGCGIEYKELWLPTPAPSRQQPELDPGSELDFYEIPAPTVYESELPFSSTHRPSGVWKRPTSQTPPRTLDEAAEKSSVRTVTESREEIRPASHIEPVAPKRVEPVRPRMLFRDALQLLDEPHSSNQTQQHRSSATTLRSVNPLRD